MEIAVSDANLTSSLKVSAQQRWTIRRTTAALLIFPPLSPCPQMAIMNRNKMRLGAEADNMGRCPGGYSRLSARQAVVGGLWSVVNIPSEYLHCGRLTWDLQQVSLCWFLDVWTDRVVGKRVLRISVKMNWIVCSIYPPHLADMRMNH